MKLFNTLSKATQELEPIDESHVSIYSCGPTVYDHAHIGNLSAYIFADTLRRVIKASGYKVKHVMNYTDVDDKTIRRSHEKYPDKTPKEALQTLTDYYIKLFLQDMQKIGNEVAPIEFIRATDTIEHMKALIVKLYEQQFAYIADDGIYFSIDAYKKSGKTYGQLLEINSKNTSEARINNDEYDKESVHDFALWKTRRANEPSWVFILNGQDLAGRPGWHIECSVMSRKTLGQPFDIHTGGIDLIFPHHENEIAQSTALEADPIMAQIFAHNSHILVEGKKMSKSAKNFYTLQDIEKKGFDPLAFRLMVLQSHYRHQANFSWDNLESAQNRLKGYRAMADLRFQPIPSDDETSRSHPKQYYSDTINQILEALQNDVDTPKALEELSMLQTQVTESGVAEGSLPVFKGVLEKLDELFGLELLSSQDIAPKQQGMLAARAQAREDNDWAKSDELRDQLKAQLLEVRDTDHGQIWSRL